MKSMFIDHGFAIHVEWFGTFGVDQFGFGWRKRDGYAYDDAGLFKFKLDL